MKTLPKFGILLLLPVVMVLLSNSSGSPGGYTRSPGDGFQTCTSCHTGTPQTVAGWISTNIPATGYVPGQTYTITLTATHTGVVRFGFELTAENVSGNKVGTFIITNSAQTKLVNNNKSVTHTLGGTFPSGNSKTWNVNWTAPTSGTGSVTFYAAFNAANGNGNTNGDVIYTTAHTVNEAMTVNVTFRVDMSNQTVSPLGVFIAGSFQGWNTTSHPMNPPLLGKIYSLTVPLVAGSYIEYKFLNGSTWENFSGPCTTGSFNNRFLTVPSTDITLPAVCFNSCNICNPPQVQITFQVDMSQQTVAPDGVFLAGTFNNWAPTATPMAHVGNQIYAVTLTLGAGDYHQYKFKNGAAGWENVPPACAQNSNRYIIVPPVSTTLDAVCYGSCHPCGPPPVPVSVTFQVDMSNEIVSPQGVHIAGGFQGWNPGSTPMIHIGNGIYTFTTTLNSGTYQEYKFINGNTWAQAEWVPPECASGNNRFFTVPNTNTVLPLVCFGMCTPCPLPQLPQITFQVDMSEQTISPEGVFLVIQGGNPAYNLMTLSQNNVYTITLPFPENQVINYKFSNGTGVLNNEPLPPECRIGNPFTGYWRTFTVPANDFTLPVVCFGQCGPCVPVSITFRVDLSNEVISPVGVHIAGSFQGWNPGSTPMMHIGNGIFQYTHTFSANEYIEYKFINGNTFAGAEQVPEACGVDDGFGGFNRYLTIPQENTVLDVVCFGSCVACVPPLWVDITFQVDMSHQTVHPAGVYIAGSFQGWNSSSHPMNAQGNGIYTYTTSLLAGEYIEFKFLNGPSFDYAEQVPWECNQNGNRYLTVPSEHTILEVICFGMCTACPLMVSVTFRVDMSLEEVSPQGVHLVGDFQGWIPDATPMTSVGNQIYSAEVMLPAGTYQTYRFLNGNSYLSGIENVPEECGVDDGFGGMKRYLTVPDQNTVLDVVCFGMCWPCPETHHISLPLGWSGLSSYLMPMDTLIEELFSPILPHLVILKTLSGIYYPQAGINTIGTWMPHSAYQIKLNSATALSVAGYPETSKTVSLNEGWNLIPVVSQTPVPIDQIFSRSMMPGLILIKEVAGTGLYWPLFGINTLDSLVPGKAYFVKTSSPAVIIFP